MNYKQLVREFGSGNKAAKAIGVTRAAVSEWKRNNCIPTKRQVQIQHLTQGRLKAELPKYRPPTIPPTDRRTLAA